MKLIEFNKNGEQDKNKVIESFKKAKCFIAVSIQDGRYVVDHHGMTEEQIIYASELIKLNLFEGNLSAHDQN